MSLKTKSVTMVISAILLIIGVATLIPAFLERNTIIIFIDLIVIIIGVILFAASFGE